MQKTLSKYEFPDSGGRKKVAFVCPCYPPAVSGVGDYTAILKNKLEHLYDIHVITEEREVLKKETNLHFPWWKQAESMWLQFDAVIFQYTPHMYYKKRASLFSLINTLKKNKIPVIAALHEFFMPEFGSMLKNILFKNLFKKHDIRFIKSLDEIIITIPDRTEAVKNISSKDIHVIPVGSNIPRIKISKTEIDKIRKVYKTDLLLGSFGNFHPDKRYETVLGLLEKNPDWKWICLGGIKNIYYERLQNMTVNKNLQKQVFFYTNLTQEDVSRYLQALDIFIMTDIRGISARKGSGLAAVANGCAVAAKKTRDTEYCFKHGKNIIFFKDNPQKAVSEILKDKNLRDRIKRGALKLNDDAFSWDNIARKYSEILEKYFS